MIGRCAFLLFLLLLPALAQEAGLCRICGGWDRTAKPALAASGRLSALVIFAKFQGEAPGNETAPFWAEGLFDPNLPGSFAHFYREMSRGRLQVQGRVLPKRYASRQPAAAYLAERPGELGRFGQFNREILEQADQEVDLGEFDNDGPDGIPNSGDDDGYVDIVFVNLLTVPKDFLIGTATGYASLGLDADYLSDDPSARGGVIRVRSRFTGFGGTTQRGHLFSVTAATMCHEFGHVLGLVDLFDQSSVGLDGQLDPAEESAGIGKWGLMGLGTLGWGVEDGPNAFCAWSLARLGWVEVVELRESVRDLVIEDIIERGRVYKIPLTQDEYFLLENRQASGSYYNRNIPASGLLIWHVDERADNDEERHKQVDLVCADGLFADRGFPGTQPDPIEGRDNLDFWSQDPDYAASHRGNQGDATDPFDGVRFTRFAADTNPRLAAHAGFARRLPLGIAVENIRAVGKRMVVDVLLGQPLVGHVTGDTTWSGIVEPIGDVVVEPGARLTLAPGTQVRFPSFDWHQSGFDPALAELLVYGELAIQGTREAPVSIASTQRRGRWGGLFLLNGQELAVDHLRLENAVHGLVRTCLPPGVTHWSGFQPIPLDLVVPANAELVVEEGTLASFAGDLSRRGIFPELTELIVEGRLTVLGSATRMARFTGDMARPDSLWCGVRLRPGAQVEAHFLQVERAGYGLSGEVSENSQLYLVDSRFAANAVDGLHLAIDGQARVERTAFERHPGQAIWVEGRGVLELRDVAVQESGQEGIFLGNASLKAEGLSVENSGSFDPTDPRSGIRALGGRGQHLDLRRARIAGSARHGLELDEWEGEARLEEVEVSANQQDGMRALRSARVSLDKGAIEGNQGRGAVIARAPVAIRSSSFVANEGAGLVLQEGVWGTVEQCAFGQGPGLELDRVDSLVAQFNRFEHSPLALSGWESSPQLEGNRFQGNVLAVQVRGGKVPASFRRNVLVENVVALENRSPLLLQAAENYWGTADSAAIAGLIKGPVVWIPFLDEEPDLTVVTEIVRQPGRFALHPAYPNPFNGAVAIPFAIAEPAQVRLVLFDMLGRPVRLLLAAELEPGEYLAKWDGRDESGQEVAAGLYLYRLQAGPFAGVGRLVLVR